ncbi:helix-turn-helix domain-containing protein [Streptomyces justiciae]|uniref:Helix-turn-helix domain-containing protein n=1 Tax=Streptomyces justiciae TaxID=2780140 RepID=A0ABU3M265_9ACTN|nr:helix-turn-helix domain-containing protein [Streptomyces justiciae]MDT7845596.1 helix-turn-helix domain-containing protein [Streptomyces justiciae]
MPTATRASGATLRHLAPALIGPLVELLAAPDGLDRPLADVVISEPDEEPREDHRGCLVLLIGVRGAGALRPLIAAGRSGAAAVAVRTGTGDEALETLRQAAVECGTALLGVRDEARWEQVAAMARTVVDTVHQAPELAGQYAHGDLFSLAQTLAALTGGVVSVEDATDRAIAYSRSDTPVDEVRRLSILGHTCPEAYLAALREAGVYGRLRGGEDVVDVAARPDLGARRRLAAGITAGGRLLGTIWVQEGDTPLSEGSGQALRGAARLAALMMIGHPGGAGPESGLRQELTAGLLAGRLRPASLAGHLGVAARTGATVIAVELHETHTDGGPEAELRRARTAEMVSLHAAAFRRTAVAARLDGRLYVVAPDASPAADASRPRTSDPGLTGWTAELVTTLRRHMGTPVQAAVANPVPRLADVPQARAEADRILSVIAHDPGREVATYEDARAAVVLGEIVGLLRARPEIHDPALAALVRHDRKHGSQMCESLLGYLDAFGDVRAVADRLHIHPNTLRYRIRRAVTLTGIDLDDPEQRLVAMLELRRLRVTEES